VTSSSGDSKGVSPSNSGDSMSKNSTS